MARYGFGAATINFDNSSGTPVDLSQYVTEADGIEREMLTEEITSVGDDDERHGSVGVKKVAPITLRGPYDDTATTGPDVLFNSIGDTRTLQVVYGASKSTSVETIIQKYRRNLKRGGLTMFEVVLQPTGAVTEA